MHYYTILKLLSYVLVAPLLSFVFGLTTATVLEEDIFIQINWIECIAINLGVMIIIWRSTRTYNLILYTKESYAAVSLGWVAAILMLTLPYMFIIKDMHFVDSIYESTSGLTTTGSSIFSDVETYPISLRLWRSLTQWLGGLGVVAFIIPILSRREGGSAKQLFFNESSLQKNDIDTEKIQNSSLNFIKIYLLLSVLCTISYQVCGVGMIDAIAIMFATVSTGGFFMYNNSFMYYDNYLLEWCCILFMFLSSCNFIFLFRNLIKKNLHSIRRDEEFNFFTIIILLFSMGIWTIINYPFNTSLGYTEEVTRSVLFQTVSIISTTGFNSIDYEKWAEVSQILLLLLMICGGCTGSTSGGMKVYRVIAIFKSLKIQLEKSFRPHITKPLSINNNSISIHMQSNIMTFGLTYLTIICIGMITLGILEPGITLGGCVSAVISCIGNVGPGIEEVGPMKNFGFFSNSSKILLSFLMIAGRVELYALLVLMIPNFWKAPE